MGQIEYPKIKSFILPGSTSKDLALKVLEESAELVEAVKAGEDVVYEFCDVLQALGNLADNLGITIDDMKESYKEVFQSNTAKGRYNGDTREDHR